LLTRQNKRGQEYQLISDKYVKGNLQQMQNLWRQLYL